MKKRSKKKVINVVVRQLIESKDGKYKLYLIEQENKPLPILDIGNTSWDSGDYIKNNLYNTLKQYLIYKKITDDFVEILKDISLDEFRIVFEVLNKGKELGFFRK